MTVNSDGKKSHKIKSRTATKHQRGQPRCTEVDSKRNSVWKVRQYMSTSAFTDLVTSSKVMWRSFSVEPHTDDLQKKPADKTCYLAAFFHQKKPDGSASLIWILAFLNSDITTYTDDFGPFRWFFLIVAEFHDIFRNSRKVVTPINCFIKGEVLVFQALSNILQPRYRRTSQWSSVLVFYYLLGICAVWDSRNVSNFGDRAFTAAGPRVWNYLLTDLRQPDLLYSRFRQSLKTFVFRHWDQSAVWTLFTLRSVNPLFYLHTCLNKERRHNWTMAAEW